jgi:peptide/nickel transport system substrate-binding protein
VARAALAAAILVSLLVVSGAGGTDAETPRRGGTVVVASVREPPCLNWVLVACSGGSIRPQRPIDGVFEAALESGPHGYRPVLVSRAVLTKAAGRFTVTYRIRPEARWSDGVPVSASDFVFAYRSLRRNFGQFGVDPYGVIRDVRALDKRTVRVVYRSRIPDWRGELTSGLPRALPRHLLRGQDLTTVWRDRLDDPKTGKPIGNGPFLLDRWERGRQITLRRNPRYWGRRVAHLDRVVLRFVTDPAAALRNGEVDIIGARNALEQGAALELAHQPTPGIKVVSTPGPSMERLVIRVGPGGHRALRDKRVRRALAYGIDRESLVRSIYGRLAPTLRPLQNTLFLSDERAYEQNWGVYRHRPRHARRLLVRSGCRVGADAIFVCGGEKLSLRFLTTAGAAHREETLRIVQRQLKRIGVEVAISFAPTSAVLRPGGLLERGDFDVALFATLRAAPDQILSDLGCGWPGNFGGYCSRLVTEDILQLSRIVDPERHAAVANRVDRRLVQDVPVIPLYQAPVFVAYRATLRGVVPSAFNDPTWNAENWWLER